MLMGVQEFVKSCTFVKKFFLVPINLISVVQFVKITGDNHSQKSNTVIILFKLVVRRLTMEK